MRKLLYIFSFGLLALALSCTSASKLEIKQQPFAERKESRTFEVDEFDKVWRAIESVFEKYRIVDRDPEEVSVIDLRKLEERELKTDWAFGRSTDKYSEYKVNDLPKKQYLSNRIRYVVTANKVLGGVDVRIKVDEEVRTLRDDGSDGDYESVSPSGGRAAELLDNINQELLKQQ